MHIRKAVEPDIPKLLELMRELACFERYIADFAVTESFLREKGFSRSPPEFHTFVAEEEQDLIGMLVYYFISFTFQTRPKLVVKELYVREGHRGKGIGKLLMTTAAEEAVRSNCIVMKWQVAPWNAASICFGSCPD